MAEPVCLEKLEMECGALMSAHPPVLRHPHKQFAFDLCRAAGYQPSGNLNYSRWRPGPLPEVLPVDEGLVQSHDGFYDYASSSDSAWHVNFADPRLFVAYGSGLLAQDEIQVLEHPVLGSLRQALIAKRYEATTEDSSGPTPVLVQNAERVCAIDTRPSEISPKGLYGNRFQAASLEAVRAALKVFAQPTRTNLIAIAAPLGSGRYSRQQIDRILTTAFTGFRAAKLVSAATVEIHTGFWGCGAFGGNRTLMVMLQLLAARMAQVPSVVFHLGSVSERPAFDEGRQTVQRLTKTTTSVDDLLKKIVEMRFPWGTSDGN